MKKRSIVYVRFPKVGLGNKMLVWARGYVFAKRFGLELYTSAWWGISWGSWLRRERKKRLYWGYFKEDTLFKRIKLFLFCKRASIVKEPLSILINSGNRILYVFENIFISNDFFNELKPFRNELKEAIYNKLRSGLNSQIKEYKKPVIGIHIRRGDFNLGSTLTPISFFIDTILVLRAFTGKELPVEVFTDAHPNEIIDLMLIPGIKISDSKPDILDILLLSESDICILSIGSTFSFWAGFISDKIVLKHPKEWHPPIRPNEFNINKFEGLFDPSMPLPDLLKINLIEIYGQQ